MTATHIELRIQDSTDPVTGERLWAALAYARAGERQHQVADLEDAAFRLYLPMARTFAQGVTCDTAAERQAADQAAELGLADAVLGWRQPTSGGFRRFARSSILRHLLNR